MGTQLEINHYFLEIEVSVISHSGAVLQMTSFVVVLGATLMLFTNEHLTKEIWEISIKYDKENDDLQRYVMIVAGNTSCDFFHLKY